MWYYTNNNKKDVNFAIPHTKPNTCPEEPIYTGRKKGKNDKEEIFEFLSPAYDLLETNIPHTLMNYSDRKFPGNTPLFPEHTVVKHYLRGYAEEIRPFISFQTQVIDVSPLKMGLEDIWKVTGRDLVTKNTSIHHFDAVVIANGHYSDPYVPAIAGIEKWNRAYPGAITHSKFYRRPEEYGNKASMNSNNHATRF